MTREQTVDLVRSIVNIFPNWKPENLTETVNAWHWALEEYPAEAIKGSLQIYLKTNKSGFAPSVSQLIDGMHKPKDQDRMTEGEAWYLVKKAIADSAYNAKERFDELPAEVQRAVGGVEMLRAWGQMDSEEVNSVVASNFQRTYKAVIAQQEYAERVPAAISDMVKQLSDGARPDRIGVKA